MKQVRLLLVEDDITDQMTFQRFIKSQQLPYDYTIANSVAKANEILTKQDFDIVLLDHQLGDGTGFDILEKIHKITPAIFITGSGAEDIAVQAIKMGAYDYLKKDIDEQYLIKLPITVFNAIKAKKVEKELAYYQQQLEQLVEERTEKLSQEISDRESIQLKLIEEKERAEVTLSSIGDAVISTDIKGIVDFINPAAEQLTGWKSNEAIGQPLEMVFDIVNEATRIKCENPVVRCIRENKIIGLANHTILISRQGVDVAIEDSAAPIRNLKGELIGIVLVFHDVTQARRLANELNYQATHDPLTELNNRREFERRLHNAISSSSERSSEHAMLYLDLDQFKVINDTCGHVAGDELLRQISSLLDTSLRDGDTLARLGGDEFGILLENCPLEKATEIAKLICKLIKEYLFIWDGQRFYIGGSIGLVPITKLSKTLAETMIAADMACYSAKENGRNCVHIVDAFDTEVITRKGELLWVSRLRHALQNDSFVLYFQKISNTIIISETEHVEILLRLKEGDDIILPGAFIPAAERYNLMPDVDRWVINAVFKYCNENKADNLLWKCAINLCGESMCDDSLIEYIQQQQKKYHVSPGQICFEVTETAAITNLNKASSFMIELKALGYCFALDDFGSGMSSFAYLKNLPIDFLKIDGVFVKDIAHDPIDFAMVKSINEIGHAMGLKTIAEFVENNAILKKLEEIGVDYVQGYGIGYPEPLSPTSGNSNAVVSPG